MKTILNLLFLVILFTFSTSCSTEELSATEIFSETTEIPETKAIEIEIMELINAHRLSQGLNALQKHDIIKVQTSGHSNFMAETSNVSHINFYARKSYLVYNAGAAIVTENVAYGYTSAQSVVNAWIKSDAHKLNMEGDYTNFNVSAVKNADNKWYFTNIFMK